MTGDERDPLDDALARGLGALAPSEFDLDADRALGSMRPALRRARTRRRVAVATSTLGVFVAVVAGAAVLQHQPASRVHVSQRTTPTVSTAVQNPRSTTTHVPTSTSGPHATTTTTAVPAITTPVAGPGPTATLPTTTTKPETPSSTTTVPAPTTKTYTATGGRITIRFASGRLTLLSSVPASGFTPDVRNQSAGEIEVRFSNGTHESRIRIRVKDGALEPEITEN